MRPFHLALVATALAACQDKPAAKATPYVWDLPASLPEPAVPDDNPMSVEKVELGRHLFYDKRLSVNGTRSCGSCHPQAKSFSGGTIIGTGATGEPTLHNEPTLINVAFNPAFTWADPNPATLEEQLLIPMFGDHPVELGLADHDAAQFDKLRHDKRLSGLFAAAYPDDEDPVDITNIADAIASFERTILSGNSPYDKFFVGGDVSAIPPEAVRGVGRFFSEDLECYHCHGTYNFTDASVQKGGQLTDAPQYYNTGQYNLDGQGAYPAGDQGLITYTNNPGDMGMFKSPTLRNVTLTAPYMHDGSIPDLDSVLDSYAHAGRVIADGPNAGDGSTNPFKSIFLKGFDLSDDDRRDVTAFLTSLTDQELLDDPALSPAFDCPTGAAPTCPSTPPSYATDVAPILQANCVSCHTAGGAASAELLDTYDAVHALHDKVGEQVTKCLMPADGRLSDDLRKTLLEWLACGDPQD